jgi:hypothetical protein
MSIYIQTLLPDLISDVFASQGKGFPGPPPPGFRGDPRALDPHDIRNVPPLRTPQSPQFPPPDIQYAGGPVPGPPGPPPMGGAGGLPGGRQQHLLPVGLRDGRYPGDGYMPGSSGDDSLRPESPQDGVNQNQGNMARRSQRQESHAHSGQEDGGAYDNGRSDSTLKVEIMNASY